MDFLGVGLPELAAILALALIFIGPRELPKLVGRAGQYIKELRALSGTFTQEWQREVNSLADDTGIGSIKSDIEEIKQSIEDTGKEIKGFGKEVSDSAKDIEKAAKGEPQPRIAPPAAPNPEDAAKTEEAAVEKASTEVNATDGESTDESVPVESTPAEEDAPIGKEEPMVDEVIEAKPAAEEATTEEPRLPTEEDKAAARAAKEELKATQKARKAEAKTLSIKTAPPPPPADKTLDKAEAVVDTSADASVETSTETPVEETPARD